MKAQGIKKNIIYSTIDQVSNVLVPFITAPYIARVLGADGIGIDSFTGSIHYYFILLATLGTMTYGAREISMNRDDPYKRSQIFWEIELMKIITSVISLILWMFFLLFVDMYKEYFLVRSIGFFSVLFDIAWFFNGLEEFKIAVIRNVFFRISGIFALFLFVKDSDDLFLSIFITFISGLLASLSLWPYLRKYLVCAKPKFSNLKKHFKETFIYFVPTIATSIYTVFDKTLIGLITHDTSENGYYQQAEGIVNIAKNVVFASVNSVLGVRIAFLYAQKKTDEIEERIEQSLNYIFFMGFGCCFGIMGIAKSFVPFFLGEGYDEVISLLYIFSPIIIIIGISNCLGSHYYTPCGKRAQSAKYIIAGSLTNLMLNVLLIPCLGSIGAAIASIFAELLIAFLYVKFSGEFCSLKLLLCNGLKKLIAGIIMFIIVLIMNLIQLPIFLLLMIQIMSGAILYVVVLALLKDKWVVYFLKNLLNRLRN